jgi:hypothetical protein
MPLTQLKASRGTTATGTADSTTFLRGDNSWASAGAAAGQVIQVKTATDSSTRTTSSTSFTAASNTLSVSITPASASNKMFLMANLGSSGSENDQAIYFTIYRDSTNLGTANFGFSSIYTYVGDVGSTLSIPASMSYLDSPSTTSSITYQVRFRASAGTVGMNEISPSLMSLTVMEIKG